MNLVMENAQLPLSGFALRWHLVDVSEKSLDEGRTVKPADRMISSAKEGLSM
jgi:hypothetical protein